MHPTVKRLVPAVLILAAVFAVQAGLGRRLAGNTINPIATLDSGGNRVALSGPFTCSQVEWVAFRVTVTQRTTGAIAEGYALRLGSTTSQQWQVLATTRGDAAFEPGPAVAVAVAVSTLHGEATDAHQWLVPVTLQE
jgi:hypothetical protein